MLGICVSKIEGNKIILNSFFFNIKMNVLLVNNSLRWVIILEDSKDKSDKNFGNLKLWE